MPWKDPEKRKAKCRKYHAKHKERLLRSNREYHAENATSISDRKRRTRPLYYLNELARRYNTTADVLIRMREAQGNACALCLKANRLVVDHDHDTGLIRGWLCISCNGSLGVLGDNAAGLMRALLYVSAPRQQQSLLSQATGVLA